jgi:hypothetical protein
MGAKSQRRAMAVARTQAGVATEPASADDELAACCPDLDHWPASWRYEARDVAPGRQMVEGFKPFLRHLLSLGLSRKTLRRHRDNLWRLGARWSASSMKFRGCDNGRSWSSCARQSMRKADR